MKFSGPKLKIERAKQHINDLQARIREFETSGVYDLSIESDPDTGNDVLKVKIVKSVPYIFALIIGDTLHNLKSALDFAINDIVFSIAGVRDKHTRFPFRETRDELAAALKGGKVSQASEAILSLIMDVIKPYKGGNDALWALHDLNILDKHRLLLPVMQINAINDICYEYEGGEKIRMGTWIVTRTRTASHKLMAQNVKITDKGNAALLIVFDNGLPFESKPVIPTLEQFTELVSGVIEAFEVCLG
jgi:hypothetical protein